ncbi:MAG: molecular chaperone HtpG, partial [Tannerella sp.]|nr:molecular chaperone HtpG [Tannerella sp.]
KDGTLVYLYSTNPNDQYSYIQAAKDKGYNVLLFDGQLDIPLIGQFEQKFDKTRFVRVDSDTIGNIISKGDAQTVSISEEQKTALQEVFKNQLPKIEKVDFIVSFEAMGAEANPVMLTQSEYMRRMRDMASIQPGMSFYGEMPDSYSLVLNTDHKLIKKTLEDEENVCSERLKPILDDLKGWKARQSDLRDARNKKKQDEITEAEKEDFAATNNKVDELVQQRNRIFADYAKDNKLVSQLIDLALLSNGMLKGESLSRFIRRSAEMID